MAAQPSTMPWHTKVREVKERCPEASWKIAKELLHRYRGYSDDVERAVNEFYRPGDSMVSDVTSSRSGFSDTSPEPEPLAPSRLSQLPRILINSLKLTGPWKIETLIGAVQRGESVNTIRKSLTYYHQLDSTKLKERMNTELIGFPAIFYIVETDDLEMIRTWVKYGGDPNATCAEDHFPLLAFAILHSRSTRTLQKATSTVELLLTLGASPDVIPRAFYMTIDSTPPILGSAVDDNMEDKRLWCTSQKVRKELSSALNVTQRYRLLQASKVEVLSRRRKTVASWAQAEGVAALPHVVIGQDTAIKALMNRLIAQLALERKKPLVLMFAGPSGHGKTELARRLGELTSSELQNIDCTTFSREDELFGPRPPYYEYESGSPLNNFLAKNSGRRSIVFLDEFEKTNNEIRHTFLILFEQGEYLDRRNSDKVDCSKTIWVLATNQFDNLILKFYDTNLHEPSQIRDEKEETRLVDQLRSSLKKACIGRFGAPLSGRVSDIIPFLPFSPEEQAVVSHKAVMELEAFLRRPVVVSPNGKNSNPVGNIRLHFTNEFELCSAIAQENYSPQLGARSLLKAVTDTMFMPILDKYLEIDEEISNNQPETRFTIGVNAENEIEVWHIRDLDGM
ncbi:P-loop containing nucleoside triphosphate hydrolase protein [Nemania sp. FL0031]|nr:P-loop containing nucleoside triphosphate hydrolase protein [Nemania sp. FL0031]